MGVCLALLPGALTWFVSSVSRVISWVFDFLVSVDCFCGCVIMFIIFLSVGFICYYFEFAGLGMRVRCLGTLL